MGIAIHKDANQKTIYVKGNLDFKVRKEFRAAYEATDDIQRYIINFRDSEYLDTSALGMLLLMKDHVAKKNLSIELTQCSPYIKNVLTVTNFHNLFVIK